MESRLGLLSPALDGALAAVLAAVLVVGRNPDQGSRRLVAGDELPAEPGHAGDDLGAGGKLGVGGDRGPGGGLAFGDARLEGFEHAAGCGEPGTRPGVR